MKEFSEKSVLNIHLKFFKIVTRELQISVEELNDYFLGCSRNWNTTLQVLFIMQKRKLKFIDALNLYVHFLKHQNGGTNNG